MPSTPDFDYAIIRSSRRRTVSIAVDSGAVTVRAPKRLSERQIKAFVQSKSGWISRKLSESRQREEETPRQRFVEGEMFPFQGSKFMLEIIRTPGRGSIRIKGDRLIMMVPERMPQERIPEMLGKWYISTARAAFRERISFYSEALGIESAKLSVRGQKRRWGSCSSGGNISLNWKLVTAPPKILDYVVAHELCHIIHRNHGPEFWALLSTLIPDCRERRNWLRENGHTLGL
jgi:predicted metal-dependent hydrolase